MNNIIIPYIANIVILTPVCFMMFFGKNDKTVQAFQGTVNDSPGLRFLVGSLWLGVLMCSIIALFLPEKFISLLIFQFIYKLIFIVTYSIPTLIYRGFKSIPVGITLTFLIIIFLWPYFIIKQW